MLAVIRIRGKVNVNRKVEDTLKMLNLDSVNSCTIVPEEPAYLGMVEKCKDLVAYGKINYETFSEMLRKRGRVNGDKKLDDEKIKMLGFKSFDDLAKSIFEGKTKISKIGYLSSVFRLTPPSRGYKSTRDSYPNGSLGNWKENINELIRSMI